MLPINLHKIIPTLVSKTCPDTMASASISSCSRAGTQLHNCCPNLSIVAQKASHLKASFHPSIKPTMVAAISSSHEGASLRPRPRMSCGFGSTLPLIRLIHQLMLQSNLFSAHTLNLSFMTPHQAILFQQLCLPFLVPGSYLNVGCLD